MTLKTSDVVIIGAGPYGLSIAAHLRSRGADFRIFGSPMRMWLAHMPKGMRLKSEGFASSLYDPGSTFTLETYCKEKRIPYADIGLPVPLDVFAAYGLEFQRRLVGELEDKLVKSLERSPQGFCLRLEDEEVLSARRVVVATGLTHYEYVPDVLAALPEEFVTHSSKHHNLEQFKGRDVVVVGAGASSLDVAALLHEAGARVQVIARRSTIRFHDPPPSLKPSLLSRLRNPITGIGPGWKLFFCANAPALFRRMPQGFRLRKIRQILGPAPGWFVKEQVVGKIRLNTGVNIADAKIENGHVSLLLVDAKGTERTLQTDHVIAATGYKVDLRRLDFLAPDLLSEIRTVESAPMLSANFESSVSGLYFVGVSAANTFGPLLRFAFGAGFTVKRIVRHLAKSGNRTWPPVEAKAKVEETEHDQVAAL